MESMAAAQHRQPAAWDTAAAIVAAMLLLLSAAAAGTPPGTGWPLAASPDPSSTAAAAAAAELGQRRQADGALWLLVPLQAPIEYCLPVRRCHSRCLLSFLLL